MAPESKFPFAEISPEHQQIVNNKPVGLFYDNKVHLFNFLQAGLPDQAEFLKIIYPVLFVSSPFKVSTVFPAVKMRIS